MTWRMCVASRGGLFTQNGVPFICTKSCRRDSPAVFLKCINNVNLIWGDSSVAVCERAISVLVGVAQCCHYLSQHTGEKGIVRWQTDSVLRSVIELSCAIGIVRHYFAWCKCFQFFSYSQVRDVYIMCTLSRAFICLCCNIVASEHFHSM